MKTTTLTDANCEMEKCKGVERLLTSIKFADDIEIIATTAQGNKSCSTDCNDKGMICDEAKHQEHNIWWRWYQNHQDMWELPSIEKLYMLEAGWQLKRSCLTKRSNY